MNRILLTLTISSLVFIFCACQESEGETDMNTNSTQETPIGMLQHTVYFYLNEDVTDEEKARFEEGLQKLLSIEEVYKSQTGVSGSTPERDVTDHSFGYSIFSWFESMEDYEVYAEHPVHMDFIDEFSHLWADVKVYDSEIIETID